MNKSKNNGNGLKIVTGVLFLIMIIVILFVFAFSTFFTSTLGILKDYNSFRQNTILPILTPGTPENEKYVPCCYDSCTCWNLKNLLCFGADTTTDAGGAPVKATISVDCKGGTTNPACANVANNCSRTNTANCSDTCIKQLTVPKPTVCTPGPTLNTS
jgi:hypothetical protein